MRRRCCHHLKLTHSAVLVAFVHTHFEAEFVGPNTSKPIGIYARVRLLQDLLQGMNKLTICAPMRDTLPRAFVHHDIADLRHGQALDVPLRIFVLPHKNTGASVCHQLALRGFDSHMNAAKARPFLVLPAPLLKAVRVLKNLLEQLTCKCIFAL